MNSYHILKHNYIDNRALNGIFNAYLSIYHVSHKEIVCRISKIISDFQRAANKVNRKRRNFVAVLVMIKF